MCSVEGKSRISLHRFYHRSLSWSSFLLPLSALLRCERWFNYFFESEKRKEALRRKASEPRTSTSPSTTNVSVRIPDPPPYLPLKLTRPLPAAHRKVRSISCSTGLTNGMEAEGRKEKGRSVDWGLLLGSLLAVELKRCLKK